VIIETINTKQSTNNQLTIDNQSTMRQSPKTTANVLYKLGNLLLPQDERWISAICCLRCIVWSTI